MEHVDELRVVVERERARPAVVVLHEHRALRADDVAARVRNRAEGLDDLLHLLGRRLERALAGLVHVVAVVPVERDGRELDAGADLRIARAVGELHDRLRRIGRVVLLLDPDALRVGDVGELQPAERHVHRVARHVAERAAAEVEEAAPREGVVDVLAELPGVVDLRVRRVLVEEGARLRRGEPGVPVETLAHRIALRMGLHVVRHALTLRPHGAVRPHVDLRHVAEDAALDDLRAAAHRVERGALVAHLRDDAHLAGGTVEVVEFPERAHERLLHVDVDAELHRLDRDGRVDVVRRGDGHRLDAELHAVVEQLAVVGVERHLHRVEVEARRQLALLAFVGDRRRRARPHVRVRIAHRDDLGEAALHHRHPVRIALAHHAHDREADLVAELPDAPGPLRRMARQREASGDAQEPSSAEIQLHCPFSFLCRQNLFKVPLSIPKPNRSRSARQPALPSSSAAEISASKNPLPRTPFASMGLPSSGILIRARRASGNPSVP